MSDQYVIIDIPSDIAALHSGSRKVFFKALQEFLEPEIKGNHTDLCDDIDTGEIGTIDAESFQIENIDIDNDGKGTIDYSMYIDRYMGCKDLDGSDWEYGAIHFEFSAEDGTVKIKRHEITERDTTDEF